MLLNTELKDIRQTRTEHLLSFVAVPKLEEVQLRMLKREDELKTEKRLHNKQLERESRAMCDSIDQKNLIKFSHQEHFLAWYQSVDQIDKSIQGGLDSEECGQRRV